MLAIGRLILCVALGFSGSSSSSAESREKESECERLLRRPLPADEGAAAAAELFLSWMDFRHPELRDVLRRTNDVNLAFALFFLTTGFHLPPPTGWFGPGVANRPHEHWLRAVRPTSISTIVSTGKKSAEDVASLMAKAWTSEEKLPVLNVFGEANRKVESSDQIRYRRLGSMLRYTLDFLERLVDPTAAVQGETFAMDISIRMLLFAVPNSLEFPKVELNLKNSFTDYELESLRRMRASLANEAVRINVFHRLNERLDQMMAEHQTMCKRLRFCTDVEKFRQVHRSVKAQGEAGWSDSSLVLAAANPAPQFEPEDVVRFLEERTDYAEGGAVPWFDIMHDLNRAADLLGKSLLHLESWRADRFDWTTWSEALHPSIESLKELRYDLSRRSTEVARAKRDFEVASAEILRLAEWVARTNAYVVAREKDAAYVAGLPYKERLTLGSVVSLLPPLTMLMERAVGSIEMRTEVMIEQVGAMSSLLIVVADLAEERLRYSMTSDDLRGSEKFEAVREALGQMANAIRSASENSHE